MPSPTYEELSSATIDAKRYRLVRLQGNRQSYVEGQEPEPPWQGGAPNLVSAAEYTWHLGALKSRPGIPATSEYGKNRDARWYGRLLPSAKLNTLTLTSSASTPSSIFEAFGYVFAVCGRRVYRIDPTDDSLVLSKDFGAGGTLGVMGLLWEGRTMITTDDATQSLWTLEAGDVVGGGPDSWGQTADVVAYRLGAGINRLFKVDKAGNLRNVSTGLDPETEANYADNVQCGDDETVPTGLVAYERTVFIGKPEGLFGVGDDGFGVPLVKRMAQHVDNCMGLANFDPWVIVPHVRGLYRMVPGEVQAAGIERELLNESPVKGFWRGFSNDGDWLYGLLEVGGTETYVMVGRDRRGEPALGPMIWDTWLHFAQLSKAVHLSALTDPTRLYFGYGNNIAYVELANGPGAIKYVRSAQHFSVKHRYDDWNPKDFPKLDVVGKNVDATTYWEVFYSVDGGAFSNQDINSANMRVNSDGKHSFILPVTAVGREVQYRFDYTSDDEDQAGEIDFFEPYARPQSLKTPVLVMHFLLAEGIRHDESQDDRTAVTQLNDLLALTESAAAVDSKIHDRERKVWVSRLRVVDVVQEGNSEPSYIVEVAMQVREAT